MLRPYYVEVCHIESACSVGRVRSSIPGLRFGCFIGRELAVNGEKKIDSIESGFGFMVESS